jgi:hypothetical protein
MKIRSSPNPGRVVRSNFFVSRRMPRPTGISRTVPQLFPHDPAKGLLQRLSLRADVLSESSIDESLVVPSALRLDLRPKPLEHIVVDANRDPRLALRQGIKRTPPSSAEILQPLHKSPSA